MQIYFYLMMILHFPRLQLRFYILSQSFPWCIMPVYLVLDVTVKMEFALPKKPVRIV